MASQNADSAAGRDELLMRSAPVGRARTGLAAAFTISVSWSFTPARSSRINSTGSGSRVGCGEELGFDFVGDSTVTFMLTAVRNTMQCIIGKELTSP